MSSLEKRLNLIAQWLGAFRSIADVGAAQGRLTKRLWRDGHQVWATELTVPGYNELHKNLTRSGVEDSYILHGNGLLPLMGRIEVDAVVIAGMGAGTIIDILQHRGRLMGKPSFVIQPMQGMVAMHRFLIQTQAKIMRAQLIKDKYKIYATWMVQFGDNCEEYQPPTRFLNEFWGDPLLREWIEDQISWQHRRMELGSTADPIYLAQLERLRRKP